MLHGIFVDDLCISVQSLLHVVNTFILFAYKKENKEKLKAFWSCVETTISIQSQKKNKKKKKEFSMIEQYTIARKFPQCLYWASKYKTLYNYKLFPLPFQFQAMNLLPPCNKFIKASLKRLPMFLLPEHLECSQLSSKYFLPFEISTFSYPPLWFTTKTPS